MQKKKIIIIGGGAAGFFAAANIVSQGATVLLLEKSSKVLSKVAISGGGRCNVTNGRYEEPKTFARQYPRGESVLKKSLYHFGFQDTIQWFTTRGVPLKLEADGRMFPQSNTSESIVDCLMGQALDNNCKIIYRCAVTAITHNEEGFTLDTTQGVYNADIVIIATGGASKLDQWQWLSGLNLPIISPVPSLFTFNLPKHPITGLMGVSIPEAKVKIQGSKYESTGPMLITHWGLSGPAVLRLSAIAARWLYEQQYSFGISINWLGTAQPDDMHDELKGVARLHPHKTIVSKNQLAIPHRLWDFLITYSGIDTALTWGELSHKNLHRIVNLLINYEVRVSGKTTFKEEFVSAGGIDTKEINPQTFESKTYPNLFIVGEALDIDGITGGFNFQNAWTGAWLAAQTIVHRMEESK